MRTRGIVSNVIHTDKGSLICGVRVFINGKEVDVQPEVFYQTPKIYNVGDTVLVDYYFTKNLRIRLKVIGDAEEVIAEEPKTSVAPRLIIVAIILLVFFVLALKAILG